MQVAVESIAGITSRHGGEVIRIDGFHTDETGRLAKGYCFIDPKNDNWQDWVEMVEIITHNRGNHTILDNVRMKKRDKGLWNADSRPTYVDTVAKHRPKSTNNNYSTLFDPEDPSQ